MPFNGAGGFTVYTPGNPAVPGTAIGSVAFNATMDDFATGLANTLTRDGQSPATANIPMGGNKITGLGPATVAGQAVRFEQLPALNKIINGNFGINQRAVSGTVVLTAGQYGHDRFKAGASGCTYTFATSANVTTLTISAGSLVQVIEGVNLFSGSVVLSWAGTAQGKIGGGSYGVSGVLGTATGGTNMSVEFGTGTLSKVQLEYGATPSVFEQRPYGLELALCQRYYELINTYQISQYGQGTSGQGHQIFFKTTKRAPPTLTQTNVSAANCGTTTNNNTINIDGFTSYRIVTATGQYSFSESATASAELSG